MDGRKRMTWEALRAHEVARHLHTNIDSGLSKEEVKIRLKRFGGNRFSGQRKIGLVGRIVSQFKSPLVFVLLLAGVATIVLQEFLDSIVIAIALSINVIVGTFQEQRAGRAFQKLNESQEQFAKVLRNGEKQLIPAIAVVPGDIIYLESGYAVPADVRLVRARELSINEAALTGEWVSVSKDTDTREANIPLTDRKNMAWMGTLVSNGYGIGIAVSTGDRTEVGKIAKGLALVDEQETPLQKNIRKIARFLVYIIGAAIIAIFILGLLRGEGIGDMILVSIAVAVAAIPSGLPAAVTIVLAIGMESILKRGGLVRSLRAAETLGSTTVILTDKTGTLTQARMNVASVHTHIAPDGGTLTGDSRSVLEMAVVASDAFVEEMHDAPGKLTVHGRPIEKAIVLAGLEEGISQNTLAEKYSEIDFLQFASKRRFTATLTRREGTKNMLYVSGAPEKLLSHAEKVYAQGEEIILRDDIREKLEKIQRTKSKEGMRMIAVGYRMVTAESINDIGREDELLKGLVFGGLIAFEDPIREDVKESIHTATEAGTRVIMLTGDNPETARSVAIAVGIGKGTEPVITGLELEELSDEELLVRLEETRVFARVLPQQKLRLVHLLKGQDEVVAMTGDGVNDAPALQSANIGVAVGSGTEVAKEASDMVLMNNSFSIITAAIEEGRKIIDNLKKIVAYLLSTSFSEILLIGGALAVGAPLPLLPTQILWANIVEEGMMSFSFAFEKKEPGIMKRNPRSAQSKEVLTKSVKQLIALITGITGAFLLVLYFILLSLDMDIERIRTIMFVALSLDSIFFALSFKNLHLPLWRINPFSNRYLVLALVISLGVLVLALATPALQKLLTLATLSPWEWAFFAGLGIVNLGIVELGKMIVFRSRSREAY